jgi:hypothetical protein
MVETILGILLGVFAGKLVRYLIDAKNQKPEKPSEAAPSSGPLPGGATPNLWHRLLSRARKATPPGEIVWLMAVLAVLGAAYIGHVHAQRSWFDYVTVETAFVRLLLSGIVGFSVYWIVLLAREPGAYVPQFTEGSKFAIKYITIVMLSATLVLAFYMQPPPLLQKVFGNISQIEALGLKLQMQTTPQGHASQIATATARQASSRPFLNISSFATANVDITLARELAALVANRSEEPYYEVLNLHAKVAAHREQPLAKLFAQYLVPATHCLILVKDGRLPAPELDGKMGELSFLLARVLEDQFSSGNTGATGLRAYAGVILPEERQVRLTEKFADLFRYLGGAWGKAGLPRPTVPAEAQTCGILSGQDDGERVEAIKTALTKIDARQEHLFAIASLFSLYHLDRHGATQHLDDWVKWVFVRQVGGSSQRTSQANLNRDLDVFCSGGTPDGETARESVLLLCMTYLRVKIFQYAMVSMYVPDTPEKLRAMQRLLSDIAHSAKAVVNSFERTHGNEQCTKCSRFVSFFGCRNSGNCLRSRCLDGWGDRCPEGVARIMWLASHYEMQWLRLMLQMGRDLSAEEAARAKAFCTDAMSGSGFANVSPAVRANPVSRERVRAQFTEVCARLELLNIRRQLADEAHTTNELLDRKDWSETRKVLLRRVKSMMQEVDTGLHGLAGAVESQEGKVQELILASELMGLETPDLIQRQELVAVRNQLAVLQEQLQLAGP